MQQFFRHFLLFSLLLSPALILTTSPQQKAFNYFRINSKPSSDERGFIQLFSRFRESLKANNTESCANTIRLMNNLAKHLTPESRKNALILIRYAERKTAELQEKSIQRTQNAEREGGLNTAIKNLRSLVYESKAAGDAVRTFNIFQDLRITNKNIRERLQETQSLLTTMYSIFRNVESAEQKTRNPIKAIIKEMEEYKKLCQKKLREIQTSKAKKKPTAGASPRVDSVSPVSKPKMPSPRPAHSTTPVSVAPPTHSTSAVVSKPNPYSASSGVPVGGIPKKAASPRPPAKTTDPHFDFGGEDSTAAAVGELQAALDFLKEQNNPQTKQVLSNYKTFVTNPAKKQELISEMNRQKMSVTGDDWRSFRTQQSIDILVSEMERLQPKSSRKTSAQPAASSTSQKHSPTLDSSLKATGSSFSGTLVVPSLRKTPSSPSKSVRTTTPEGKTPRTDHSYDADKPVSPPRKHPVQTASATKIVHVRVSDQSGVDCAFHAAKNALAIAECLASHRGIFNQTDLRIPSAQAIKELKGEFKQLFRTPRDELDAEPMKQLLMSIFETTQDTDATSFCLATPNYVCAEIDYQTQIKLSSLIKKLGSSSLQGALDAAQDTPLLEVAQGARAKKNLILVWQKHKGEDRQDSLGHWLTILVTRDGHQFVFDSLAASRGSVPPGFNTFLSNLKKYPVDAAKRFATAGN